VCVMHNNMIYMAFIELFIIIIIRYFENTDE